MVLEVVSMFFDLSRDELSELEEDCRFREFESGSLIIGYGDPSDDVYFLINGKVEARIYSKKGKEVALIEIGPGQSFGEFAAIDGAPRSASVETLEQTTVAIMSADRFRALLMEKPAVSFALLGDVVGKLRALTERVHEFSTQPVFIRVCAEIYRMACTAGVKNNQVVIFVPSLTELAARVSTTREGVSRVITKLRGERMVERLSGNHHLLLKDVEKLAAIVRKAMGS